MKRKRWSFVATAAAVVVLVVPAVGQGQAARGALGWSLAPGGPTLTSYDFGAVDGAASVTRRFRLGNSSSTQSGKLTIRLTGSPAFSITSDGCTAKSIGRSLSCWVGVTDAPSGAGTSDSAMLTATGADGAAASLSLSGSCTGPTCLANPVSWGSAIEVPGTAALNVGGHAGVNSVSCPSAGACVAGGSFGDGTGWLGYGSQAFVASEQGGVWGNAIEVPGTAALDAGGGAAVTSVSCSSAGNCAAGGSYGDGHSIQAFVVSETGGVWGTAISVPGLAARNLGRYAYVTAISCGSPGNCTAGGVYTVHADGYGQDAFLVDEENGIWGAAFKVAGGAAHNHYATVTSISCAGAGDCVVGGSYTSGRYTQAFVAVEKNGTWGQRKQVPGMKTLTAGGSAWVSSVSCPSSGNCTAAGTYSSGLRRPPRTLYAFVVEEKDGKWGQARKVAGSKGGLGNIGHAGPVSCPAPGNCEVAVSAGTGDKYGDAYSFASVVSEKNGKWGKAILVPGTDALTDINWYYVSVTSLSCASRGNCAAAGVYMDRNYQLQVFVAAERNGVWDTAEEVPGTAMLGDAASPVSVSCAGAGNCAIGGSYADASGHSQAFVTAP